MKYLPFQQARKIVHSLGLKSQSQWREYCKLGKKPYNIPANPERSYSEEWKGVGDWLGTGRIANQNKEYRTFFEAREFVRGLKLLTGSEWKAYCKAREKPHDIPNTPWHVYRTQWKNFADWLGTETSYLPFEEARKFLHRLGLKSYSEWKKYCKSGKKPSSIPLAPDSVYKSQWKGWGDFLSTGRKAQFKGPYLSFESAKKYIQSLGLKNLNEWAKYARGENRPVDIPAGPARVYKDKGWKGYGDWLGTGRIANQQLEFLPFTEAKKIVQSVGLKNGAHWRVYVKSGKKPDEIPANPAGVYREYWKGWGDWLGTATVANFERNFKSFKDAREFVHTLRLPTQENWREYCRSGKKPADIPANPGRTYGNEWKGFGDWLGTGRTRNFLPFKEARTFARRLGLNNTAEWSAFAKTRSKPGEIPGDPAYVYKKDWKSWGDWLGTDYIANRYRGYRPFEAARTYTRSLGLKTQHEWRLYARSKKKPVDIPTNPHAVYQEWTNWFDWFGIENKDWSITRIKSLLKGLIESRVIFDWDEAVLYSLLLRKGLLNISGNRHEIFFKNLVQAARTNEGRTAIENYIYSESDVPPDLQSLSTSMQNIEKEIQVATPLELEALVENSDPLDYQKVQTVEQILTNTNALDSINVDEEAMQFYVNYSIGELWKLAFQNEGKTVDKIRLAKKK